MRICYLADSDSIHNRRWIEYLRNNGHEVYIITSIKSTIYNTNIYRIGLRNVPKLLSDFVALVQCHEIIKRLKPDILHAHYITGYGVLGSLINYQPFIISIWGSDILIDAKRTIYNSLVTKYVLLTAKYITCTNEFLKNNTEKYLPSIKSKIDIVPFGVDIEKFKPKIKTNVKGKEKVIGLFKAYKDIYGLDLLIRAIPIIINEYENVKVIFAGRGDQSFYRIIADENKVLKYITFLNEINHDDMPDYLSLLDIYVMPSLSESFGVAAIEAQAMEIPVVAANIGGIPETICDGKTGYLFEAGNIDDLARKILRLLEDDEMRIMMGKNGRKYVIERYNWKDNAKNMENIYRKMFIKNGRKFNER